MVQPEPMMVSEDFSEYGHAGVPSVLFWVGATEPGKFAELKAKGESPPMQHSPLFAPDRERTIRTGMTVLTESDLREAPAKARSACGCHR